ncbi:uncharacterized protein LOC130998301 [Salvia miltiorrhiza]|uniref:uncharacterized protein LOC130998301 n=1 Tax=Salvia miltiorrhiza TaxID=226208 RepID=UPI0025AB7E12|nr:uncharacterized protein LOC130998301 [Salvia miltiorrhiza]
MNNQFTKAQAPLPREIQRVPADKEVEKRPEGSRVRLNSVVRREGVDKSDSQSVSLVFEEERPKEKARLKNQVSQLKHQLEDLEESLREKSRRDDRGQRSGKSNRAERSYRAERSHRSEKSRYIEKSDERELEYSSGRPGHKDHKRPHAHDSPRDRREHGRDKEDKRAKTSRFHPINNRSPFSDDILADTLPRSYKLISLDYDGTTDPEVHLNRFEGLVTLHMYTEGIKCRIFSTTLTGPANPNSIYSFEDLQTRFLRQFASSRRVGKSALSLMDIKQDQNETLREYTARFNLAALEVPEAESQIKNCAYVRGLRPGIFFDELQIRPAKDFDDIMARLPGYLQLEDARMARKAENDKHKVKRAEEAPERQRHQDRAPFRGLPPRVLPPQGEMPPQQQRTVNEVTRFTEYTPLNKPQEEIFHLIKNQPFFRAPGTYRDGPP